MERLSNSFSLLDLADEDCQSTAPLPSAATASSSSSSSSAGGQGKRASGSLELEEYKQPLVWIDLEMTGLNIEVDRIMEIACIITDGKLTKSVEGPDIVIHQTRECLDKMGEWCQTHHGASDHRISKETCGLTNSTFSWKLCLYGFYLLEEVHARLAALFSHVLVDVSSVKALSVRWYPKARKKAPMKENKHRAMDDIRESIKELKYYKESIFKSSKSKR